MSVRLLLYCVIGNNLLIWKYFTDCRTFSAREKVSGIWEARRRWKLKCLNIVLYDWYAYLNCQLTKHSPPAAGTLDCPFPVGKNYIHTRFDMLNLCNTLSQIVPDQQFYNRPPLPLCLFLWLRPQLLYWVISYSLNMICQFIITNCINFIHPLAWPPALILWHFQTNIF